MNRTFRIGRVLVIGALALGGCTVSRSDAPPLTGPSEVALSLLVTASPDYLSQDGRSQSMVSVLARDPAGQPVGGLTLRLGMFVGGTSLDYGTLTTKAFATDSSGYASTIYTAPVPPSVTATADTVVEIRVAPVSSNYGNTFSRTVSIRLARPGVILPPNPSLAASFFYSPLQPHENESVQFDASASTGAIVSFAWNFGDGSTGIGQKPVHTYAVAGVYSVTLTVTDDRGQQTTSAPQSVSVILAPDPIAAFTLSPTDAGVNEDIYFDASASSVPAGRSLVAYSWNFGDGAVGAGQTSTHKYGKANTYTVVLTVTDSTGRRGVTSKTVQVK